MKGRPRGSAGCAAEQKTNKGISSFVPPPRSEKSESIKKPAFRTRDKRKNLIKPVIRACVGTNEMLTFANLSRARARGSLHSEIFRGHKKNGIPSAASGKVNRELKPCEQRGNREKGRQSRSKRKRPGRPTTRRSTRSETIIKYMIIQRAGKVNAGTHQ